MAWGTNMGLGRMGEISDLPTHLLARASENYLRPETLRAANDLLSNAIAALPISRHYDLDAVVHSSSDGQKTTPQSIIVRKLSAYERWNRTRRALWEYDSIFRSLYLLEFVDSPPLRQNMQRALNRGENYHQLRRAIAYANFGKQRAPSFIFPAWWVPAGFSQRDPALYGVPLFADVVAGAEAG